MPVVVAGVGYEYLRDHSAAAAVLARLQDWPWADGVVVEDLSYNPIAVAQWLDDGAPGRRFDRAVLVGAVERGRRPGAVTAYRWDGVLPAPDEIHRAITEAVTGVIALDNTLVVTRHLGALPDDAVVVEIEPAAHAFGEALSDAVAPAVDEVCRLVTALVADPGAVARLPRAPLGGVPVTAAARTALQRGDSPDTLSPREPPA